MPKKTKKLPVGKSRFTREKVVGKRSRSVKPASNEESEYNIIGKNHSRSKASKLVQNLPVASADVTKEEVEIVYEEGGEVRHVTRRKRSPNKITEAKLRVFHRTGMMPLDFMMAVMRDEVFTQYERHITTDGDTFFFVPALRSEHIPVSISARLSAAMSAAPYCHRKKPIGIEDVNRKTAMITADQLSKLEPKELDALLKIVDKLGVAAEFEGHAIPEQKFTAEHYEQILATGGVIEQED